MINPEEMSDAELTGDWLRISEFLFNGWANDYTKEQVQFLNEFVNRRDVLIEQGAKALIENFKSISDEMGKRNLFKSGA